MVPTIYFFSCASYTLQPHRPTFSSPTSPFRLAVRHSIPFSLPFLSDVAQRQADSIVYVGSNSRVVVCHATSRRANAAYQGTRRAARRVATPRSVDTTYSNDKFADFSTREISCVSELSEVFPVTSWLRPRSRSIASERIPPLWPTENPALVHRDSIVTYSQIASGSANGLVGATFRSSEQQKRFYRFLRVTDDKIIDTD